MNSVDPIPEPIEIAHGFRRGFFPRLDRFLARYHRPSTIKMSLDHPRVSFSFDDFPDNAAEIGAKILEDHGKRGTFYVAGKLCGRSFRHDIFASGSAVADLATRGHEIGCHTYSHADVQLLDQSGYHAEIAASREFREKLCPLADIETHAYPYGSVGLFQKTVASRKFAACRGVRPGLNYGAIDLAQLRAVPLYDSLYSDADIAAYIEQAAARKAWLVFYTHDVADTASYQGTSTRLMEFALSRSIAAGCEIAPIVKTLEIIRSRSATSPHRD
jgi:peptidoglycan/xylan/chitin deacetylase (PgdA/CDA1 family)